MPFGAINAIEVGLFNLVVELFVSLTAVRNPNKIGRFEKIGFGLFSVGSALETVSEFQRMQFRALGSNKGKLFTGGLFSISRNVNYLGYTLWRTGLATFSGSTFIAALTCLFFLFGFSREIPKKENYLEKKYPEFQEYKKVTQAAFLPGIW